VIWNSDLLVGELVQALENKYLEHEHNVVGLGPGRLLVADEDLPQQRPEQLKIDIVGEGLKRIVELGEGRETLALIEETGLI